ncbi:MAG: type II CRISPR-associated endonuclease Cas1 [bacterium]
MQNRIIEIVSDQTFLSLYRGFMKVTRDGHEPAQIPLPDIGAVIIRGYGASLSLNLAARLAEEKVPVLLCDGAQRPSSILWPLNSYYQQGYIVEAQARMNKSTRKRLWQALIKSKIRQQAQILKLTGHEYKDFKSMVSHVKSGDPDNIEAQAARRYWTRLMQPVEPGFIRDRTASGANAALNYGYTILRAAMARSIIIAGLHPAIALHHDSKGEGLRLADDLMEPFRPFIDLEVYRQVKQDDPFELTREHKLSLVKILSLDLEGPKGASPIQTCMDRLCRSLADICIGQAQRLTLPGPPVFHTTKEGDG